MQQNEQELNLKKRARRRLVGALALVLMMVIFLPMVLKNPATPTASDEDVKITLTQKSVTEADAEPDAEDIITENLPETPVEETPVELANEPKLVEAKPVEELKPVETPVAAKEKQDEASAPAAKPQSKPSESNNSSQQKFYVQIGVFSEMPNVKQLQGKLTDLGYSSSTEKISTDKGTKIRLRTKTFDNRNEAAIALQNIKDAGLTGMVVSQ